MIIKVLGPGCARCKEAEELVRAVAAIAHPDANVEKVTDLKEMMALGVMSTPAVVVDGVVKCTGRIPSRDELTAWMTGAGNACAPDAGAASACSCGGKC